MNFNIKPKCKCWAIKKREREGQREKLSQSQTKNAAKKTETETDTSTRKPKTCKKNVVFFSFFIVNKFNWQKQEKLLESTEKYAQYAKAATRERKRNVKKCVASGEARSKEEINNQCGENKRA